MKEKRFFTGNELETIRALPIAGYLSEIGHEPCKMHGSQLFYKAPYRNEKTASFKVDTSKNIFYDFGTGANGDIIKLCELINGVSFVEAVKMLKGKSFSFHCPTLDNSSSGSSITIHRVKPLENKALVNYLQSRKIPYEIAREYLSEIYYYVNDKHYFSLGFANNMGGYELRNAIIKLSVSPKAYTLIKGTGNGKLSIFEGFFDFLSAFVYFKQSKPNNDILVLNSLVHIGSVSSIISQYDRVYLFLDNDNAGSEAAQKILSSDSRFIDCSYIYKGYKDFNDFICIL